MADVRDRERTLPEKLHSLSGVVPLGAFVLLHLWVTSALVGSREIYDRQIAFLHSGPLMGLLEVGFVLAPLAYHALYGIRRIVGPRDEGHAYANDLMATLQRASGIIVLLFVGWHVWEVRAQTWISGLPVSAYSSKLTEDLSSTSFGVPWIALGYLVGSAATLFHLVNGLSSFCTVWGYTPSDASQRRARSVFRAGGIVFFALSAGIVLQLATGARYFPEDEPRSAELPCGPSAVTPPPPLRDPAKGAPSSSSAAPGTLPGAHP